MHPTPRALRRIVLATGAALALSAAPALASEGTVVGTPLPNPLAPVVFAPAASPVGAPQAGTPARRRAARPRITRARLTPRKVVRGHRSSVRLTLAAPARVRVVLERRSHGRTIRVKTITIAARGRNVSVRLPARLAAGSYRVRIVATDAEGQRSRESRRSLSVIRRAR